MKKRFNWLIGIAVFVLIFTSVNVVSAATDSYERISGDDRILTAIEMSKVGWPLGLSAGDSDVILARADNPIDALAASNLAGYLDAPILLTYPTKIRQEVLDEINRLGAENIYIVGGTSAVSTSIENKLKDSGLTVYRAGKKDRYYTAGIINTYADAHSSTKALVVNGSRVADAVSAASEAALNKVPVYLATKDELPIQLPKSIKDIVIYGGVGVLSEKLEKDLRAQGYNVTRKSGADRYKTNVDALASLSPVDRVLVVRGTSVSNKKEDYPDAVASSGLAARLGAHIMISDNDRAVTDIKDFLQDNYKKVYVIGGQAAIQPLVMNGLNLTKEEHIENHQISYNSYSEYHSLNQHNAIDFSSFEVINNVMEGLLRIGPDHQLVPGVAKSYKANDDYTEFVFHLRKDAKWTDNRPVLAEDFVKAWQRAVHPATESTYSYLMDSIKNAKSIQSMNDPLYAKSQELGVKALDDYTLKVELEESTPYFAFNTAHPYFFPQPRWADKDFGSERSTTWFNGPFILSDRKKDGKWTLKKNELYWDYLNVNLKEMTVQVTKDTTEAMNLYQDDKLDMALIREVSETLKSNPDYKTKLEPVTFFLELNHKRQSIQNKNLRKALMASIDRQRLVGNFNYNQQPAHYLVPKEFTYKGSLDFRNQYPSFNLSSNSEVQALWTDAKEQLGVDTLTLELLISGSATGVKTGQIIKDELESSLPGLNINVTAPEKFVEALGKADSGDFDLYFRGWGPDYRDPSDFLNLYTTNSYYNYGGYSNTQYDQLVQDVLSANRWENLQKAERILVQEDAAVIPLMQRTSTYLQKDNLKGVVWESVNMDNLKDFKWTYVK